MIMPLSYECQQDCQITICQVQSITSSWDTTSMTSTDRDRWVVSGTLIPSHRHLLMHNCPQSPTRVPKLKEPSLCPNCTSNTPQGYLLSEIKEDPIDPHLLLLLRSGPVQDAEEKSSILTTIEEDYGVKLDSLNAELSQLKIIMNQLETRRSNLELQISYQSSLLSPIRRLPNELLGEILLYSAGGRVNVCSPRSDIWTFEKVCKKWRDISLSSEIWSSIDVSLESIVPWKPGTPMGMVAHLVELCLRRSRNLPLSVKFEEIGSPVNFKDIFDILSPYSNRWEELFLSLSMLPAQSPALDHGLTMLNFLSFSGAYKSSTPLDTFRRAPQLQRLHLNNVTKPLRSLLLPWSQITDFKAVVCQFRTGEFVGILKAMPNVVRFTSRWNKGIKKINVADNNHIHLRHLKMLNLATFPSEAQAILQLLTFPLLTDLTIASGISDPSLYTLLADSVASAINRSSCQLRSLSLQFLDSSSVARILPHTPWVENLHLGSIQSAQGILEQLIWPGLYVPRLRSFSLECIADQGVTCIGPLVSVIRSRSYLDDQGDERGGHLRMVNLTLWERRGGDPFVAILQPLGIETGVRIDIETVQVGVSKSVSDDFVVVTHARVWYFVFCSYILIYFFCWAWGLADFGNTIQWHTWL